MISSWDFIQTRGVSPSTNKKMTIFLLGGLAKKCESPLMVYKQAFIYFDRYTAILQNTIHNVTATSTAMFIVSLGLILHPLCSLWVTFAVASVIEGVTSSMAVWSVSPDSRSTSDLVFCHRFLFPISCTHFLCICLQCLALSQPNTTKASCMLDFPVLQSATSMVVGCVFYVQLRHISSRLFF